MTFPNRVKMVEVSPRDGLQNEKETIPTEIKIELINRLSKTGLQNIEVTSFVSNQWIPQLADNAIVLKSIIKQPSVHYPVLIPNVQGLESALSAGAKEIAVFCAASETFSKRNTNCSIEESLNRIEAIFKKTKPMNIPVRAYISCSLGCPFEGSVLPETVANLAYQLIALGSTEISIGDTIGVGTPKSVKALIHCLTEKIPVQQLAVHFHDTYGQALANIYVSLELGISIIDSSISGLGGCPYAKGATGNVATEDVLYMLNGLGIETGVDLDALIEVSRFVVQFTGHPTHSKVAQARLQST